MVLTIRAVTLKLYCHTPVTRRKNCHPMLTGPPCTQMGDEPGATDWNALFASVSDAHRMTEITEAELEDGYELALAVQQVP